MSAVPGLPLLLCLGPRRREGGEDNEVSEFQDTAPPEIAPEESSGQTSKQITPDIWAEVRVLKDMVVELKVELRYMKARVKDHQRIS